MNIRRLLLDSVSDSTLSQDLTEEQKLRLINSQSSLDSKSSMRFYTSSMDYEFGVEDGRLKIVSPDGKVSYLGQGGSGDVLSGFVSDSKPLSVDSTDAEQLDAFYGLMLNLQRLYYPNFDGDIDDLAQDFWEFLNSPLSFRENLESTNTRNVPQAVKFWAIRWLQNQERSVKSNKVLSERFREELNRASGHINLSDYIDEAYNRIYAFTDKQLVSFIRKFRNLSNLDKGFGVSLDPEQVELFNPLFEKAQFLLAEMRSQDSSEFLHDSDGHEGYDYVELDPPLLDLLSTLFYESPEFDNTISDSSLYDLNNDMDKLYEDMHRDPDLLDASPASDVYQEYERRYNEIKNKVDSLQETINNITK